MTGVVDMGGVLMEGVEGEETDMLATYLPAFVIEGKYFHESFQCKKILKKINNLFIFKGLNLKFTSVGYFLEANWAAEQQTLLCEYIIVEVERLIVEIVYAPTDDLPSTEQCLRCWIANIHVQLSWTLQYLSSWCGW